MDLFEVLFVVLFLLIPVIQGVLGKGRGSPDGKPGQSGRPGEDPTRRPEADDGRRAGPVRASSDPAAEMLPDDLWELLTGERRERAPVAVEAPEEGEADEGLEAWSTEPRWASGSEEPDEEPVLAEPAFTEPVSLEYVGPEAYSLEQPLPSPEVRHARFHDRIERDEITGEGRGRRRRRSSIARALRSPAGIRDAVVLAELLGRPKGLE